MNLRNRLRMFNGVLVENVPNNNKHIIFKIPNHNYIKLKITEPNGVAMLILNVNKNKKTINYAAGETNVGLRGRGYGTFLRAIPIRAAKNTGYKTITHTASFRNNKQKLKYTQPPSMRIVRFLGFKPNKNMKMVSKLNLNNVNMNRINRIIKRNYSSKEYSNTVGPRK